MAEFAHKCNTCLAAFPSLDAVKEHYRGDWHVLNSKRRAAGQPPLRREQFMQVLAAAPKKASSAPVPSSSSAKKATTVATTQKEKEEEQPKIDASVATKADASHDKKKAPKESMSVRTVINGVPVSEVEDVEDEDSVWEDEDDEEAKDEDEEDEEDEEAQKNPPKLGATISLFDDKDCQTVEQVLEYMAKKFGFFVPDLDYLTDLNGLLEYLGEKIKLGQMCLFCQKRFSSARATQHHMVSKSHCKLCYEEGTDLEEFEDFYDFSSTYEDLDAVELDENGDVIQEEMEISNTGELVLPGGRILGHRAFRRYYKQYYRPMDTREDVLAQQREELLRLGQQFGGPSQSSEVSRLSEVEVMAALVKYHKQIRRGQVVEQRAALHREGVDQRREYKSKVNKLRSSEITTAKIRDYHGMLK